MSKLQEGVILTSRASPVKCADGNTYELTNELLTISRVSVTEHGMCPVLPDSLLT